MIRPDDEPTLDLDWFALDAQGAVAHFTTGGCGGLPRSVAASREDVDRLRDFFLALPETGAAILNPNRASSLPLFRPRAPDPAAQLRPWTATAARGLYAYDFVEDRRRRPRPYAQVARPELPLHADELPAEIRAVLQRTVLGDVVFASDDVIPLESLL